MLSLSRLGLRKLSKFRCTQTSPKVLVEQRNRTCVMTLNNPRAFNALDEEMLAIVDAELERWDRAGTLPQNLVLRSDHPKAFCAGGDVVSLVHLRNAGASEQELLRFFKKEFEVDFRLAQLVRRGVQTFALWDGIVMGGGVGISAGCGFRVASEKTLFAMPETRIGLFVDVAVSFYLTRLAGGVGRYLALLGHRLKGAQVFLAGLANAFVPHARMAELEAVIVDGDPKAVWGFLSDPANRAPVPREEALDWVALSCVVSSVFAKTHQNTALLVRAHEDTLEELCSGSLDLAGILSRLRVAVPEDLAQGGRLTQSFAEKRAVPR